MYQVYADGSLIFDSRFEEYVIAKGQIDLEVNKSGSFVFTLYRDHPYYDRIEKLKTIITVYRDNMLIFRGRVILSADGFYYTLYENRTAAISKSIYEIPRR